MTETTAKLTWSPPRDDGGAPITNYTVEMKQPMEYKWSVVNASFTVPVPVYKVEGLKKETDYIFRVTAQNKAGQGPPSEPSDVARYGKFECLFLLSCP